MANKWKTEDGYVFTLQPDGTVGDGDMSWPSKEDFFDSMKDNEIKIKTISGGTETSKKSKKSKKVATAKHGGLAKRGYGVARRG